MLRSNNQGACEKSKAGKPVLTMYTGYQILSTTFYLFQVGLCHVCIHSHMLHLGLGPDVLGQSFRTPNKLLFLKESKELIF